MERAELVQQYLQQEYVKLLDRLDSIFERFPALAVRMLRGEVELFEQAERFVAGARDDGEPGDLEELTRFWREDRD